MATKRIVSVDFWEDEKIIDYTPEDKYFFLYLLTCPASKQVGIYRNTIKRMAYDLGYSQETVAGLIVRFQERYGVIEYDKETQEIFIKNYLKHSIIKGGKPVFDCMMKDWKTVKSERLKKSFSQYHKNKPLENETAQKFVIEVSSYYLNDNDNDNDNECIADVSSTIRKEPTKKAISEVKHKYGEFNNVSLKDSELRKLQEKYPNWEALITKLDEGKELKGYKYKSDYLAILKWAREDEAKAKAATPETSNPFLKRLMEMEAEENESQRSN